MSTQRAAFLHDITSGSSISAACAAHGISRKTGHKWLLRARDQSPHALFDRSRRPLHSPRRSPPAIVALVLQTRDHFGWGPQKIHDYLSHQPLPAPLPSPRTLANILLRHQRVAASSLERPEPQRFERSFPNQLWQFDHKGSLEIDRQRVSPLVVIDDHSRYLFALAPCLDKSTRTAWDVLWRLFERYGMPDAVLCDNAFSARASDGSLSLSWIEMCLIRLGITPLHGRPYHPQTQGKVERLNGTLERELFPRVRRDALAHFEADCELWRTTVYNTLRPHEALGGRPPVTRWIQSSKKRPAQLPDVTYPEGSVLRKVGAGGDLSWRGFRFLAGTGLAGQWLRLAESAEHVEIFFGPKALRKVQLATLSRGVRQ